MNQPQGQQPPPATPPQGYMAQPPQQPVYYAPQPQTPQTSSGNNALWIGAGGILAAVVLLAVVLAFLLASNCGNKQQRPTTHEDPTMTVRMRVPNPIKAARERNEKLERANKALAEKLDKERKQRLEDLKDAKKKLAEKLEKAQKKLDGMKGAEVEKLKKDLRDLKEKLAKKPKVVTRWRTKKAKGDSATTKLLKEHLVEFKALNKRVKAITNKGTKGTSTGGKPPKGMAAAN